MPKRFVITLLLFLNCAFAQTDSLDTVMSKGVGRDQNSAKKQAFRNAVELAMGAFISTESIVENYELISDEILSYSDGYIIKFEVLNTIKREDGLIEVLIRAAVRKGEVKTRLTELSIFKVNVDGESLFAEAFSKIEVKKQSSEILKNLFKDYPQAFYITKISKPKIIETNLEENTSLIRYTLRIEWNKERFIKMLDVLKKLESNLAPVYEIYTSDKANSKKIAQIPKDVILELHKIKSPITKIEYCRPRQNSCSFIVNFNNKDNETILKREHNVRVSSLGLNFGHVAEFDFHKKDKLYILNPSAEREARKPKYYFNQLMNCDMDFEYWLDNDLLGQINSVEVHIDSALTRKEGFKGAN